MDVLDGAHPFDEIAGGRYERMLQVPPAASHAASSRRRGIGGPLRQLRRRRAGSSGARTSAVRQGLSVTRGGYSEVARPSCSSVRIFGMTTETSIDVMAELGILEPHEVARLLKLRHSTVLDLSRRGVLPAFKIGKHWRYRRADPRSGWCAGAT